MKRFISSLTIALFLAANLMPLGASAAATYAGPNESNSFADKTISAYASGTTTEETTDAIDTGANDFSIGQTAGDGLYIGSNDTFDGISLDIDTTATGGKYILDYWDGTTWDTLISETTADLKNDSTSGVFSLNWDRPSDWTQTAVTMSFDESGAASVSSGSLYFVRLRVSSSYTSRAKGSQVGILNYNAKFNLQNELGSTVTGQLSSISFSSSTGDATVYAEKELGNGAYEYALYTPSSTSYTYTIDVSGYVEKTNSVTLSETSSTVNETLQFTQVLVAKDPATSSEVSIALAVAGTANETCSISSKRGYCSLTTAEDNANFTVYADGYSPISTALYNRTADAESQAINNVTMGYAYLATVKDENGNLLNSVTVKAGDNLDITCISLGSGQYGCIVPISQIQGDIQVTDSDYDTEESTFSTIRNSNDDAQVTQTFTVQSNGNSGNDGVDLRVSDLQLEDNGDLKFTVENQGDEDTDNGEDVFIYVNVEGDKVWSESYENDSDDDSFLDAGEEDTINAGDNLFDDYDDGDRVDVEVCVDAKDTIDEDDEDDNCREETVEIGGNNSNDEVDLEITDLYTDDDGDLKFVAENTGDEDVASGKSVTIYVYVDGDLEWSESVSQSSGDDNEYLDADDSTTFNVGDNVFDNHGDTYDVEVCVDSKDTIDESSENNNCMEEDESELDNGENDSNDCSTFIDIDNTFATDYICNLYDRGSVNGKTSRTFDPEEDITRAEFLKIVLLDAGMDPYATSNVFYDDVSSNDWYYSYITYATTRGYVEGFSDGTFRPNDDLSRAEAVVILLNVYGEDDQDFSAGDIDFWDVGTSDWFAYAVVIADENNIVEGYTDNSFRPYEDISRAEAAKIVDVAYNEFN